MGAVKSCCHREVDDKLLVTKMDLSHCGCIEVPHIVFNAERCIETLILASNQISSLPPQLFHCQEMKHLNLNDNCLSSLPPAIGSFLHLVSLKLDKNNLQELPDNIKMCKKLKRLSLSNNPWKQMPSIVTQIISLEELYMCECELNYMPASIGRLSKLKIIELRNNNLCHLPLSMSRLESLTRIDISDNEFIDFPTCITKLKNLRELMLDSNDIEEIIDIKSLVHLEHLDASYNHITNVSETIGCCTNLNMLNLSFNYIDILPNSIGSITHLQTLQLEMNELTEIPKSIGKLSHLEELNLCNNKLYSLPNTIGLLRNLRNLNVSRNIIQEFPPEIGSCSKLAIINAAYNRLQVLPPEIGYLNNLKVLDLVGNFLMYLPITITNIRGVRAIWLSANQNVPLIPFTEDLNLASGERFLTNIALPQLGEIPLRNAESGDAKDVTAEKTTSWGKKIRFAEDEDVAPGKLHRTPTPFPKELRAPNRKHQRNEEPKTNDNYVNVIDGKVSEQETPLLQPPPVPVTKSGSGLLNLSESSVTKIREANIRRSNKDSFEMVTPNLNGDEAFPEANYNQGEKINKFHQNDSQFDHTTDSCLTSDISPQMPNSAHAESSQLDFNQTAKYKYAPSPSPSTSTSASHHNTNPSRVDNSDYNRLKLGSIYNHHYAVDSEGNLQENMENSRRQQVIYSNLVNSASKDDIDNGNESALMDPQKIREMYHNDIIYGSNRNPRLLSKDCRSPSANDFHNANVENQPKYLCSNSTTYFSRTSSVHSNQEYKRVYSTPPPPPPPPLPLNKTGSTASVPNSEKGPSEPDRPSSKQDFISLAEQMKNRNIAPPCYEIAKMYSTKAALFENNRVDQKSN